MKEILIELYRQGLFLKCTAIDPETGEEAVAFGPAKDEGAVKQLAMTKLKFKLNPKIAIQAGLRA
jgi:hypothetical protein